LNEPGGYVKAKNLCSSEILPLNRRIDLAESWPIPINVSMNACTTIQPDTSAMNLNVKSRLFTKKPWSTFTITSVCVMPPSLNLRTDGSAQSRLVIRIRTRFMP